MAETNVPSGTDSDNPATPQTDILLSPATVAQIRTALVEALSHHGGDLEAAAEPGLSAHVRDFEAHMRSAIGLLDGAPDEAAAHVMALCERSAAETRAWQEADPADQLRIERETSATDADLDGALDQLGQTPITSAHGAREAATALSSFIEEHGVDPHEAAIQAVLRQIAGFTEPARVRPNVEAETLDCCSAAWMLKEYHYSLAPEDRPADFATWAEHVNRSAWLVDRVAAAAHQLAVSVWGEKIAAERGLLGDGEG